MKLWRLACWHYEQHTPLIRDWRPRHVRKVPWSSDDLPYCHQCGRQSPWPCSKTTWLDRLIVALGGRSR